MWRWLFFSGPGCFFRHHVPFKPSRLSPFPSLASFCGAGSGYSSSGPGCFSRPRLVQPLPHHSINISRVSPLQVPPSFTPFGQNPSCLSPSDQGGGGAREIWKEKKSCSILIFFIFFFCGLAILFSFTRCTFCRPNTC